VIPLFLRDGRAEDADRGYGVVRPDGRNVKPTKRRGVGRDRVMAIPKTITREALNLLSPDILRLAPHLHPQFKAELAELREDNMHGVVALFEKWNDMLSTQFPEILKKGHS
jgi:hypothetical protein